MSDNVVSLSLSPPLPRFVASITTIFTANNAIVPMWYCSHQRQQCPTATSKTSAQCLTILSGVSSQVMLLLTMREIFGVGVGVGINVGVDIGGDGGGNNDGVSIQIQIPLQLVVFVVW